MKEWTTSELEALYQAVNERGLSDPEFKKKYTEDPVKAVEEVAGCELPEDFALKVIEKDNSYSATYVVPDFADGELNLDEMEEVAGGASTVLFTSICAAAMICEIDAGEVETCTADSGSELDYCVANICDVLSCAADVICDVDGGEVEVCTADSACAFDFCAAAICDVLSVDDDTSVPCAADMTVYI